MLTNNAVQSAMGQIKIKTSYTGLDWLVSRLVIDLRSEDGISRRMFLIPQVPGLHGQLRTLAGWPGGPWCQSLAAFWQETFHLVLGLVFSNWIKQWYILYSPKLSQGGMSCPVISTCRRLPTRRLTTTWVPTSSSVLGPSSPSWASWAAAELGKNLPGCWAP